MEKRTHLRSVALVHPRIAHATHQLALDSADAVAVDIEAGEPLPAGGKKVIRVVGLYNPASSDPLHNATVTSALPAALSAAPAPTHVVVAGDFNLRHPLWQTERTSSPPSEAAESAVSLLSLHNLDLALPPNTHTFFSHNRRDIATLDLVIVDLQTKERVISCAVDTELESGSDHRPVRATIDLSPPTQPLFIASPLFRKADPATVLAGFTVFNALLPPIPTLSLPKEVDKEGENLTRILSFTSHATVPMSRPSPPGKANSWWNDEIASASRDARTKQNRAHRLRLRAKLRLSSAATLEADAAHDAAKCARNRVKALCQRSQVVEEEARIAKIDPFTLWREVNRVKGESGAAPPTPPLKKGDGTYATSDLDKLSALQPILLPARKESALGEEAEENNVQHACIPADQSELPWPPLLEHELKRAIFSARPFAATGADSLPNHLLQTLWPLLRSRLLHLFQAAMTLGHFPTSWKDAVGIVLRKPKKPDYSQLMAYRLIAFERTLAKALEKVAAQRMAYLGQEKGLEAPQHFGGRQGRAAEDAVACAVDTIQRQHRHGKVVIGVALDVASAFPSVVKEVLDEDLRKRGVPAAPRGLVRSWLTDRTCTLRLGSASSGRQRQEGLPQGSPLSPAAFKVYNSSAIEACESERSTCYGWIDDLNLFAWGDSVEETVSFVNTSIVP
ncbi:hypothetical protein JCM11641_005127 [Rhodosporidiobolus odoratus]